MEVVLRTHVAVMLADHRAGPLGHINGRPYNWTWALTVVRTKDGHFWFTGGWSNRRTRTGPFPTADAAVDDAYATLGGLR